ncbi:nucleotide pyrophosphohydrolase [Mycoplasmatota bacterium]|nr:nucleotide pyrophosphohydrolase [Mycoplasmatota bacterium]
MNKLEELIKKIHDFTEERDWFQYHNGKDLALSIVLEASELLENFQWISNEEAYQKNMQNIKDELADVLIYCFRFADEHNFDVEKIILDKMKKNAIKYPVNKK